MITNTSEQLAEDSSQPTEVSYQTVNPAATHLEKANQPLAQNKFSTHHPKSGINPLVDSAGYLFSVMGKLKQLKTYRHINKLHKDLVAEINTFQDHAKSLGYNSEYILVARYALCASLDDIITNTPWGSQGQWDNFSLLTTFNQEATQQDRFFIILERIIKEPALYIDLMEFMYICLSLGYKGSYRSTEFSNVQLEQICNALYKRIRAYHGDFNKSLSPYPIKVAPIIKTRITRRMSPGVIGLITAGIIITLLIGLGYLLDTISNQAYQELTHIGKSALYETQDT